MISGTPIRKKAAELFESGLGYKAVASQLGINRETVREWSYTWRALGSEELCAEKTSRPVYSEETKMAVVAERLRGDSMIDVMKRHQIPNRHRVKEWVSLYKKQGAAALANQEDTERDAAV